MNVADIMSENVQSCRANDTLEHAAQLMCRNYGLRELAHRYHA